MIPLVTILGPTATGKTKIAVELAMRIDGAIISADSRQVYKGMDIGTGKDLDEYEIDGKTIPYYLVDIAEPGTEYNLFAFYNDFREVYHNLEKHNTPAILCGGSGMYLESVLKGYEMAEVPENELLRKQLEQFTDKELVEKLKALTKLHNTTDITDRKRTIRAIEIQEFKRQNREQSGQFKPYKSDVFGIKFDRQVLRDRITKRLESRLKNGLVEEVQELLTGGLTPAQLSFYGLEYRFVTMFLTNELTYEEMFAKLNTAIHQFAKRQSTWFRRMEKRGIAINWIDGEWPTEEKLNFILERMPES